LAHAVSILFVDAACLNAYTLWNMKNPTWQDHVGSRRHDKRRLFLQEVGDALVTPLIARRASTPQISHMPSVARAMLAIGVQPCQPNKSRNDTRKRGRCQSCPRQQDQKVPHRCTACFQFVCGQHGSKDIVYKCLECPLMSNNPTVEDWWSRFWERMPPILF
jgi:hypothetical protein